MRLWTLHPKYLDAKGLVALWREGLLAKAVLANETKGYKNHPQLIRFRELESPFAYICEYLREVLTESKHRGYNFNANKLPTKIEHLEPVEESSGQLLYEWQHLLKKLKIRDNNKFQHNHKITTPEPHPIFFIAEGNIKEWEKV